MFRTTSFRNSQILQHVTTQGNRVNHEFKELLQLDAEC